MKQIDALLSQIRNTGASQAILQGDTRAHFQTSNGVSQGDIVSNDWLKTALLEIAPEEIETVLQSDGVAEFQYNDFYFYVVGEGENLFCFIYADLSPTISQRDRRMLAVTAYDSVRAFIPANNSGQGIKAKLPPEVHGFNWGAFFLPWFWSLQHNIGVGILSYIPIMSLFMRFFLGFRGNQWGWSYRQFSSVEEFQLVQRKWRDVGLRVNVVGVCVLLLLSPFMVRVLENYRRDGCRQNLRKVAFATWSYLNAHDFVFPNVHTDEAFQQALANHIMSGPPFFHCPSDNSDRINSYHFNKKLAGVNSEKLKDAAKTPMVWDAENNRHLGGHNVLFVDSHIEWLNESDFQRLVAPYQG